ncbi:MAG: glycine dehydrogenase (aminomethyl-transferring), partial [Myxococcales bacterium]|nr:glycine dehydrogenase (aminomethyl-transferring) [Myxococcales bacterium]
MTVPSDLQPTDIFIRRHIGPNSDEVSQMLGSLGLNSLEELVATTIPQSIQLDKSLDLAPPRSEHALLEDLRAMSMGNQVYRSFIGMGYYGTITPPVVQRNILENPGWYTQYTPYQPEISQGRLEALLNFQTMVADLTGLPLANASLLDEATAAAEAMAMCFAISRKRSLGFFVAEDCHPQTINVIRTRAEPIGVNVIVGDVADIDFDSQDLCGVLVQYPATDGRIHDYTALAERTHEAGAILVAATDLLALTLLRPPGEFGADIAIGSSQRFGVPMGYGGPHAAFISARSEYVRKMPGRIVGISRDADGNPGYRLSMQTREQHIRRAQATSNICTAQVLLAIMAGMYGAYHGPEGLQRIAGRVHGLTRVLARGLEALGYTLASGSFFDTIKVLACDQSSAIQEAALQHRMNLRVFEDGALGIALDETTELHHVGKLLEVFGLGSTVSVADLAKDTDSAVDPAFQRSSKFLQNDVFHRYHSEHEMLRYLYRLQSRDLSLTVSMIPLGSCTMKLNGTSEMVPITWPEFAYLHPFAPVEQAKGYAKLFAQLEGWLAEITGYAAVSLQPNAGSQGEYAGLLSIRAYHTANGEDRSVCLIPVSAHGTNPASA